MAGAWDDRRLALEREEVFLRVQRQGGEEALPVGPEPSHGHAALRRESADHGLLRPLPVLPAKAATRLGRDDVQPVPGKARHPHQVRPRGIPAHPA